MFDFIKKSVLVLALLGLATANAQYIEHSGVLGEERGGAVDPDGLYGEFVYESGSVSYEEEWDEDFAEKDSIDYSEEPREETYDWDFGDDIVESYDDEPITPADDRPESETPLVENEPSQEDFVEDKPAPQMDYLDDIFEEETDQPAQEDEQTDEFTTYMTNENANELAIIKTTKGEMIVEFWPQVAPKTVENFKNLARKGFYKGTCFHRIVKGFMIQGGDPLTIREDQKAMWGTGGPGYSIDAEFNDRKHVKGVLSMARSADPNSAGSQFFICLDDAPFLDGQYTAFGKLMTGEDVLEAIGNTPTEYAGGGEKSSPLERIEVLDVEVVTSAELEAR